MNIIQNEYKYSFFAEKATNKDKREKDKEEDMYEICGTIT